MEHIERTTQLNRRGRVAALAAAVCAAVAVASCGTSSGGTVAESTTADDALRSGASRGDVDGLVEIGDGRSIYTKCQGQGSPTVVLIAGKGNGAQDWQDVLAPGDPAHDAPGDDVSAGMGEVVPSASAVFGSVAGSTRVCAYDRPDIRFGATDVSTPRPQPHTVDLDVDDLHALLTALGEPPPYVLVAHSYGGLIATLFARTYPHSVGGLVMVDTGNRFMADVASAEQLITWDVTNAATSPQVREGVKLIDAFEKINAAPPLPALPAVVLSADKPWRTDLVPADATGPESVTFAEWLASLDLLAADLGAEHVTRTDSGHAIYLYNPALVTEEINGIVDDVRGATSDASGDVTGTIDIGAGRSMYVECRGTGSPTVILVSGLDAAGDLWDSPLTPGRRVFPAIAERTRVCAYDRPGTTRAIEGGGISRSDPVPQPTTTVDAVADLHGLLGALAIAEPVVLVGHSYGGVVSRLYAGTYPADVAGMVLVDSLSPELRANMTAGDWAIWNVLNARTPEQIADYPDLERIDAGESLDQVVDAPPVQQLPLVVITADELNGPKIAEQAAAGLLPPGVPADFGYLIDTAHQDAQAQVAALVEGAEHITAHSGHNVMIDNAPVVIDAVDTVVDAVRDHRSTAVG